MDDAYGSDPLPDGNGSRRLLGKTSSDELYGDYRKIRTEFSPPWRQPGLHLVLGTAEHSRPSHKGRVSPWLGACLCLLPWDRCRYPAPG